MSTGLSHLEACRPSPAAFSGNHGGTIGNRFLFDATLSKTRLPDSTTVAVSTRHQSLDKTGGPTCGRKLNPEVPKPPRDKPSTERRDPTKGLGEFAALPGPSGVSTFPKLSSSTGQASLLPTSNLRWGSGEQAKRVGQLREKSPRGHRRNARVRSYEAEALERTEDTPSTRARGVTSEGNPLSAPCTLSSSGSSSSSSPSSCSDGINLTT